MLKCGRSKIFRNRGNEYTTMENSNSPFANGIDQRIKELESNYQKENIWAFDETAVWFDSVGATTVESKGKKEVELFTTGHDKQNITAGLGASSAGNKKLPYIVFRGKGCTPEDKKTFVS